jgi:hypothetical protein
MSKGKAAAMLVHFVNAGMSLDRYYGSDKDKESLAGAKAYWDEEKRVHVEVGGRTYTFECIGEKTS